jgi:hypothetical protein
LLESAANIHAVNTEMGYIMAVVSAGLSIVALVAYLLFTH